VGWYGLDVLHRHTVRLQHSSLPLLLNNCMADRGKIGTEVKCVLLLCVEPAAALTLVLATTLLSSHVSCRCVTYKSRRTTTLYAVNSDKRPLTGYRRI